MGLLVGGRIDLAWVRRGSSHDGEGIGRVAIFECHLNSLLLSLLLYSWIPSCTYGWWRGVVGTGVHGAVLDSAPAVTERGAGRGAFARARGSETWHRVLLRSDGEMLLIRSLYRCQIGTWHWNQEIMGAQKGSGTCEVPWTSTSSDHRRSKTWSRPCAPSRPSQSPPPLRPASRP